MMIFSKKRSLILVFLMFWISGFGLKAQTSTVWDGTSNTEWYDEGATEFEIATAEQLAGLAELVNAGNDFSGKTVKLVADIVLNNTENWETWDETTEGLHAWIPIGDEQNPFLGCFDGQGHVVQGVYVYVEDRFNHDYVGLFGYLGKEAIVRKIGIVTSFIGGGTYTGALAGINSGAIYECFNEGIVLCYAICGGGIVGKNELGIIEQCFNVGKLKGSCNCLAGIAGSNGGLISSCFNVGLIDGDGLSIGGISGENSFGSGSVISSCCFLEDGVLLGVGQDFGITRSVEKMTAEEFASGAACWLLNDQSAVDPKWFQTLGTDEFPVFDNGHGVVSASGKCPNSLIYNNDGIVGVGEHQDSDDDCLCDFCQTIILSKPMMIDDVYQISNMGELYWFAGLINGTLTDGTEQNSYAKANLITDIIVNKNLLENDGTLSEDLEHLLLWTPIGLSEGCLFMGDFDGQGHTISGLYANTTNSSWGMFGIIQSGRVCNLMICDSYIGGLSRVGGIAGVIRSDGTLENVGIVKSCISGVSETGGIVGVNSGGIIRNAYNFSVVNGESSFGGIVGSNSGELSNCYYWNACGAEGFGIAKTSDEFASGAVCWLLNGNDAENPVWFQTLGSDEYPLMDKVHNVVYASGMCPGSLNEYNNIKNNIGDHLDSDGDHRCDYCGAIVLSVPELVDGVYQIANVGELYWFAALVNGTLTDGTKQNREAHAVLTADLILNDELLSDGRLVDNVEEMLVWIPIGNNKSNSFQGQFDGQGHSVKGFYVNSQKNDQGIFGYLYDGAVVKNLKAVDSYVSGVDNIGGIAGSSVSATIANCSFGGLVDGFSYSIGGIVGYNGCMYNGTVGMVVNCYNSSNISGPNQIGGIVGDNNDGIVIGCINVGSVEGYDNSIVGGISGRNYGTVEECCNRGSVTGNGLYHIGGIVGYNEQRVKNCFNTGEINGFWSVGGIIGNNSNSGFITHCFNVARITGEVNIGGVLGENSSINIANCYYLNTSASVGIGNEEGNELVTAKTMEDFASGHVARLLQGGQEDPSHPIWGQRLNGETKDLYPVLTADAKVCVYEADLYDGTNQVVSAYVNPDFLSESMTNEIAVLHDGYFIPVEDSRNVIVKDGAEYVCDNLELIDGADFYTPVPFLARKAVYRRVLPDESVWGTIAVPFAITNNDGATLYLPDEIIAEGTEESILAVKPLERMTLNPYEPALFQANVAGAELLFQATDAKIPATSDAVLTTTIGNGEYEIVGTMATIGQLEEGDLFIAQNKFWSVGTQKKVGLKAFRAYLTVPETSARVNALRIVVGDATSIRQEIMEKNNMPVDVYNASGMLLRRGVARSKALENLPAGLYIVSGKKIIKK